MAVIDTCLRLPIAPAVEGASSEQESVTITSMRTTSTRPREPQDSQPMKACPKCGGYVSIHASLCRWCWNDLDAAAEAASTQAAGGSSNKGRNRKLAVVVLLCASIVLVVFVGFLFVLTRNAQAEKELDWVPAPPPKPIAAASPSPDGARSTPSPQATSEAASSVPAEAARVSRDPVDQADEYGDTAFPQSSSTELQRCYIAVLFAGIALVCALVAFARAWR